MNYQEAVDRLERMPGCLSACLLTAKGDIITGNRSAADAAPVRDILLNLLKINSILKGFNLRDALHGVTIMDSRKKIITRFTGKASDRVLLAIELSGDANEQQIKLKVYSLFEME